MHLFEFKHFIFPFIAHALGTLVGGLSGRPHRRKLQDGSAAMVVGGLFLIGGIVNVVMIGDPSCSTSWTWLALTCLWHGSVQS